MALYLRFVEQNPAFITFDTGDEVVGARHDTHTTYHTHSLALHRIHKLNKHDDRVPHDWIHIIKAQKQPTTKNHNNNHYNLFTGSRTLNILPAFIFTICNRWYGKWWWQWWYWWWCYVYSVYVCILPAVVVFVVSDNKPYTMCSHADLAPRRQKRANKLIKPAINTIICEETAARAVQCVTKITTRPQYTYSRTIHYITHKTKNHQAINADLASHLLPFICESNTILCVKPFRIFYHLMSYWFDVESIIY